MKAVITTGSRDFSAPDADGSRLTGGSPPLSDPADLRERGDANWASFLEMREKKKKITLLAFCNDGEHRARRSRTVLAPFFR